MANPTPDRASVRVTLLFADVSAPVARTVDVAAHRRFNVDARALFAEIIDKRFGAVFESLGDGTSAPTPIVVERALYSDALGVFWAAGGNGLATPLLPPGAAIPARW